MMYFHREVEVHLEKEDTPVNKVNRVILAHPV
jgi:hypothetical protein